MPLNPCEFRVQLPDHDKFYCRHTSVHAAGNVVPQVVCQQCPFYSLTCDSPRPMPVFDEDGHLPMPPIMTQARNFLDAVKEFVSDGCRLVDTETYRERMSICDICEHREGDRCRRCGCRLSLKAGGRAFTCPEGKWAEYSSHD